jgi:hypothetical protein
MTRGRVHVVGGGVAGLAAALAAARSGREVALYEASAGIGGRCRSIEDPSLGSHDNGTHVLLGANQRALAFLDAIGARAGWVEPEPRGLPVVDLETGVARRIGLSPWSWRDPGLRPPGLRLPGFWRLARLGLPGPDRPVGTLIGEDGLARTVLAPLAIAALNTPLAEASSRRLATVLRRVCLPGAARLLVARRGLGPDLLQPVLAKLAALGVAPLQRWRLQELVTVGDRAERLVFGHGEVRLEAGDELVLALPPHALATLFPGLTLPDRYEPIVNLHFATSYAGPIRFVGLVGGMSQWALFRPGVTSVTISAAREAVTLPAAELATTVWREIERAAALLGIEPLPATPPASRVVKERRATISQGIGTAVRVPRRPLANVTLAGDWLSALPATIEAAVASGAEAVRAGWQASWRTPFALTPSAVR